LILSALEKTTVLDCSVLLPGPYCTMMLAELGANVLKIERPGLGDGLRRLFPGYFSYLNGNKRLITLDFKKREGHDLFLNLARESDLGLVLPHNWESILIRSRKQIPALSIARFQDMAKPGHMPISQAMTSITRDLRAFLAFLEILNLDPNSPMDFPLRTSAVLCSPWFLFLRPFLDRKILRPRYT